MMARIQQQFSEAITSVHSTVIKDVYKTPGQKFWVALAGDQVAGTAGVKLFGKRAEIKRMMVDPVFRGPIYRTASLLFDTALHWARLQGSEELYLGTMAQFK